VAINVRDLNGKVIFGVTLVLIDNTGIKRIDESYGNFDGTFEYLVPIYLISNSGIKEVFSPFSITASWGDPQSGYTTASKKLDILTKNTINLTLNLPDLYISSDDIIISDTNPKGGDKIDITFTVHYSSSQVDAKNVNVNLTADGGIIKNLKVSFNASAEPQNKTFTIPWKVMALESHDMNIRVTINPSTPIENKQLDYDDNNVASTEISVEGSGLRKPGGLTAVQLCGIGILIILLLAILIILFVFRLRSKKMKQSMGPEQRLESEQHGDRRKPPGSGEPLRKVGQKREQQKNIDKVHDKRIKDSLSKEKGSSNKSGQKKPLKEQLVKDLNRTVPPRIKW
jgi:hypothetical protein